jgi:hypothetical protein
LIERERERGFGNPYKKLQRERRKEKIINKKTRERKRGARKQGKSIEGKGEEKRGILSG